MNITEFATRIKTKYPQYKPLDDSLLVEKVLAKYPQYKSVVEFEPITKPPYEQIIETPLQPGIKEISKEVGGLAWTPPEPDLTGAPPPIMTQPLTQPPIIQRPPTMPPTPFELAEEQAAIQTAEIGRELLRRTGGEIKQTADLAGNWINAFLGTIAPTTSLEQKRQLWENVRVSGEKLEKPILDTIATATLLGYTAGAIGAPMLSRIKESLPNLWRRMTIKERGLAIIPDDELYNAYKAMPGGMRAQVLRQNDRLRELVKQRERISIEALKPTIRPPKPAEGFTIGQITGIKPAEIPARHPQIAPEAIKPQESPIPLIEENYLNKIIANEDKTKQFRIVKYRDKYISKRILRYSSELGSNSVGSEIEYNNCNEAVKSEMDWISETKSKPTPPEPPLIPTPPTPAPAIEAMKPAEAPKPARLEINLGKDVKANISKQGEDFVIETAEGVEIWRGKDQIETTKTAREILDIADYNRQQDIEQYKAEKTTGNIHTRLKQLGEKISIKSMQLNGLGGEVQSLRESLPKSVFQDIFNSAEPSGSNSIDIVADHLGMDTNGLLNALSEFKPTERPPDVLSYIDEAKYMYEADKEGYKMPTEQPFGGGRVHKLTQKELDKIRQIDPDVTEGVNLKRDVAVKDIYGNTKTYKKGESIFVYQSSQTGQALVKDGEYGILPKSSVEKVAQAGKRWGEFAPELQGIEDIVKKDIPLTEAEQDRYITLKHKDITGMLSNEEKEELFALTRRRELKESRGAKFSKYKETGGTNYREILIKAPYLDKTQWKNFRESHWDEPNVIAHIRLDDRVIESFGAKKFNEDYQKWVDGGKKGSPPDFKNYGEDKKALFIEEIQSDWAAKVRQVGEKPLSNTLRDNYMVSKAPDGSFSVFNRDSGTEYTYARASTKEKAIENFNEWERGIYSHPLLKNWQEITLKRVLKEAVEGGYDYLSWTTGEQQAKRYDLSKQVDSIGWTDWPAEGEGMGVLSAYKNNEEVIKEIIHKTKIDNYVGKDIGRRLIEQPKENLTGRRILKGDDLKVGGKWANNLYDKQIPNILKDLVKGEIENINIIGDKSNQALKITPQVRMQVIGQPAGGGLPFEPEKKNVGDRFKEYYSLARSQGMTQPEARRYALDRLQEQAKPEKIESIEKPKQTEMAEEDGVKGFGVGRKGEQELFSAGKEPIERPEVRKKPIITPEQKAKREKEKLIKQKQLATESAKDAKMGITLEIRRRRFNLNMKNYETNKFINDIENITTKEQREVLPFIMENTDVPEELGRPDLVETYYTDKELLKPLANQIKQHFDEAWKYIQNNMDNISASQIENYVTHIWDVPKEKKSSVTNWFITNNKFLKKRYVETLKKGIQELGLKPKYLDISEIIRVHDSITNKTIENIKFLKYIKDLKTNEGLPLIERYDKAPETWATIDHPALKQTMVIPGEITKGEKVSEEMENLLTEMGVSIGRRISPVAFGKPTQVEGKYVPSERKIRLQRFFETNTLAHEIGHHLDKELELGQDFLDKYRDELYALNRDRIESHKGMKGKYGEAYARSTEEQIAELFSFLFTDINKAMKLAPSASQEALSRLKNDGILSKLVDFDFETKAKNLIEEQLSKLIKLPVKVHPDLEKPLKIIFEERFNHPIINAYEMINGILKKTKLSISLFHHMALSETSIANMGIIKTLKVWNPVNIYKALVDNKLPAYENMEIAKKAVSRGVQLGATQDIPVKKIQEYLNEFRRKTNNKFVLKNISNFLATFNEKWDKALWDYLHDSFKIYGFEALCAKYVDPSKDMVKQEEEIAQFVNDTFGGQNWDVLMISPKMQQIFGWTLLSPDWTYSTFRQALSPTGLGKLHKETAGLRRKLGSWFWIKAGLFFGAGINLLNALYRRKDMKENPDKYTDEEKRSLIDLTMFGNTLGHKTHLFVGRYEDGQERYIRWGKQFRELPEMFYDDTGFSPITASKKKIGGKLAPFIQHFSTVMTGVSPSGFTNQDIYGKKGWEQVWGISKELLNSPLPFSTRSLMQENKEFKLSDIAMPSSKGMTRYKAIELFKVALERKDERLFKEVYQEALRNNLPAYDLCKTSISIVKATATKEINSKYKTIVEIEKRLKENIPVNERKTLLRRRKRLLKERASIIKGEKLLSYALKEFEGHADLQREINQ